MSREKMISFEEITARIERARSLGWVFEDSGLTPGIPLIGVRKPGGEVAGIVPSLGRIAGYDRASEQLDQLGVPK